MIDPHSFIAAKRDGCSHCSGEIGEFIEALVSGAVEPCQASAWLMAAFLRGLDEAETLELTLAMRDSGRILEWPDDPRPLSDKHSTGGVGDKISLILAPLAAAVGLRVPMISGRALGHTGGTLDKLESIPGFRTCLRLEEFQAVVQDVGSGMCGQTNDLAPADRILYSLRDATATVESIPLITASILSKKLAEGVASLVFDVKCGRGAFMRSERDARELAQSLSGVSRGAGVRTVSVITAMDHLLGMTAGNSLEVEEALGVLSGRGPEDVATLSVLLAAEMLCAASGDPGAREAARERCARALSEGLALERFEAMVEAQGGDLEAFERRPSAPVRLEAVSPGSGIFSGIDAFVLGEAVRKLGAGRTRTDETVDHSVGWEQFAGHGEPVRAGQPIGVLHARDRESARAAADAVERAVMLDEPEGPLVIGII